MGREEAERLVKEAVALAMSRDGSSGGVIRCVTVHAGGAERSLVLPEVIGHWAGRACHSMGPDSRDTATDCVQSQCRFTQAAPCAVLCMIV
jgi:hypothetical protein